MAREEGWVRYCPSPEAMDGAVYSKEAVDMQDIVADPNEHLLVGGGQRTDKQMTSLQGTHNPVIRN